MMSFSEEAEEGKTKMSRPFGISLLIAGCDARGPQLYLADPSGTHIHYDAHAVGSGSEGARGLLRSRFSKSLTLDAAVVMLVRILAETMEEKATSSNIELARVTPEGGFAIISRAELEGIVVRAQAEAAAEGAST